MSFGGVLGGGGAFVGVRNTDTQGVITINGIKPDADGNLAVAIDDIVLVDNDPNMAADSDEVIPTQKAVNTRIKTIEAYLDNTGNVSYFVDIYTQSKS